MIRLSSQPISDGEWSVIARRLKVSRQQLAIMRAIIEDELKSEAIALRLGIARSSVTTQIERLYAKLGIHSRVGLAKCVFNELMRIREEQRGNH